MPIIESPSEAEAQCAWLTKHNLVEGVIGEDYDTLAFGGASIVKHFNKGETFIEINRNYLLEELDLTSSQFIDFCILCGCDYLPKLKGIGPVKALKMIKAHYSIEKVLEMIMRDDKLRKRHPIPDDFNYLIARKLFQSP